MTGRIRALRTIGIAAWLVIVHSVAPAAAGDLAGRITLSSQPVPGAPVTAPRGAATRATVSDAQGVFRLTDLADGSWTLRVEMLGFATLRQETEVSTSTAP